MDVRDRVKGLIGRLPPRVQQELKRAVFRRRIRAGRFGTAEPEFARLDEWVYPGDWVLDVGANVGQYTLRFAALAGPAGRVVAVEPVPRTFELLAANTALLPHPNVTLLNLAASDGIRLAGMEVPRHATGMDDPYLARLDAGASGPRVLCLPLDLLELPAQLRLVKIDVEGHELAALRGLERTLRARRPVLIVEGRDPEVERFLRDALGYVHETLPGSGNRIYRTTAS